MESIVHQEMVRLPLLGLRYSFFVRNDDLNDQLCTYMGYAGGLNYTLEPLSSLYGLKDKRLPITFIASNPIYTRPM